MIILAGNWFFQIFGKTGPRIQNLFCLKPSPGQYGANKKKFGQIGPSVPKLLRDTQTDRHTDKNPYNFVVLINVISYYYNSISKLLICPWSPNQRPEQMFASTKSLADCPFKSCHPWWNTSKSINKFFSGTFFNTIFEVIRVFI